VVGSPLPLYQIGHEYTLKCSATGSPVPSVEWLFKPCDSLDNCDRASHRGLRAINEERAALNTVDSVLKMVARQSGQISCQACSVEGCKYSTVDFFVTDFEGDGFAVAGPGKAVQGNHVRFTCRASVYNYTRRVV
jgi:hypothetical protein